MLGIKQSRSYVTNERLYQRVNQVPILEIIRKLQHKFTGIRMPTDEPINRFVLYESKVRLSFFIHILDSDAGYMHEKDLLSLIYRLNTFNSIPFGCFYVIYLMHGFLDKKNVRFICI